MRRTLALLAAAVFAASPALAQSDQAQSGSKADAKAAALADGEVKKVDKGAGKVTIKHGPLPSLDMPPMTMVFRVKDPSMLDQLKAGDKIKFNADKVGGNYTVTEFSPAK